MIQILGWIREVRVSAALLEAHDDPVAFVTTHAEEFFAAAREAAVLQPTGVIVLRELPGASLE